MIERYTSDNFNDLLQVWEAAVRSSHDFLSEEMIELLFIHPDAQGKGFMLIGKNCRLYR